MANRKKYPKEFKLDAVSLILEQGYTRSKAAKSLGINTNMLGRCIERSESEDGQSFRGNGKLSPEQEQIRDLKKQHHMVKKECLLRLRKVRFVMCRHPPENLHAKCFSSQIILTVQRKPTRGCNRDKKSPAHLV